MRNLPFCDRERANGSRSRRSYHVFFHWYCLKFENLDPVQQQIMIGVNNNHNNKNNDNDDDDVIFQHPVIAQAGGVFWRLLSKFTCCIPVSRVIIKFIDNSNEHTTN